MHGAVGTARRIAAAMFALALMSSLVPTAHADTLSGQKAYWDSVVQQAQSNVSNSTTALLEARDRVSQAETRVAEAQAAFTTAEANSQQASEDLRAAQDLDSQMAAALLSANTELEQAEFDEAEGEAAVEEQKAAIGSYARSIYQDSLPLVTIASLFSMDSTASLSNRVQWADIVLTTNERTLDNLKIAQAKLVNARIAKDAAQEKADQAKKDSEAQVQATQEAQEKADQATLDAQNALIAVQEALGAQVTAETAAEAALAADQAELREARAEQERVAAAIAEEARKAAEAATGGNSQVNPNTGFSRPVSGKITSHYGWRIHPIYGYRTFHDGTDFAASCGTQVRAAASGTVTQTYFNRSYGNRVFINHGYVNGKFTITSYSHLQSWAVKPGQWVSQGQVIGYAGRTGTATGCHVHLSFYVSGVTVSPLNYV